MEFHPYLVCKLRYTYLQFESRHLGFSTSDFLLVQSYGIDTCPIRVLHPENIRFIIVLIMLQSSVGADRFVYAYPLPVSFRHLELSTSVHSRKF